ncbi:MAG: gamma-glutamylcyclotransferase [Anaerolineales bacterium]|nr:gamma-glutamylcyclotransferase [Anaerolineales bacterium]
MSERKQLPFFVYGTLLPDQPNFMLWGQAIVAREPANFAGGQLYDMGYYPMLVRSAGATTAVSGQLISVNKHDYDAVVQRLDALEGYNPAEPENSEYHRQCVPVTAANGRTQNAWIYLGQAKFVTDKPLIPDGDWAAYAAQNQTNLQDWWQMIDSVTGLHK